MTDINFGPTHLQGESVLDAVRNIEITLGVTMSDHEKEVVKKSARARLLKGINDTFDEDWERQAFYWCMAHEVEVPDGYEVVGFGKGYDVGDKSLFQLSRGGCVFVGQLGDEVKGPTLRKTTCEHGDHTVLGRFGANGWVCNDCGMIRKLGEWETQNVNR